MVIGDQKNRYGKIFRALLTTAERRRSGTEENSFQRDEFLVDTKEYWVW